MGPRGFFFLLAHEGEESSKGKKKKEEEARRWSKKLLPVVWIGHCQSITGTTLSDFHTKVRRVRRGEKGRKRILGPNPQYCGLDIVKA